MSFLDRVTKAVGDAVDRGKKEVDQFMRIQKINGLIGESERKITQWRTEIQQATTEIGQQALQMVRAGALNGAELQPLVDKIAGIEQQITAEEAVIAEKKAEIEKIKAEDERAAEAAAHAPAEPSGQSAAAVPPPMSAAPQPPPLPTAAAPGPEAAAAAGPGASRFCPQCGAAATGSGAFCMQCGAKLTTL